MNDFLPKPIEAEELNRILLTWLPEDSVMMMNPAKAGEGGTPRGDLLKTLEHIEGMDLGAGLSHVGGNEAAFLQMLRQFCAEFDGYTAAIYQFLEEENWREYAIRLHAMKGVFANIGADEISKWAYQLEYAAKNDDYAKCKDETAPLIEKMSAFKEKLRAAVLEEEATIEKRAAAPAELAETLEKICAACRQGLSAEADALGEALEKMSINAETDFLTGEIRKRIASLDYVEVIARAEEILRGLA
jgi:HPt (histidine-containing phosphotransfer) domain-containing protein